MSNLHDIKDEDKIKVISYPNTCRDVLSFSTEDGYEFKSIFRNGEMALIRWFRVSKDGMPIAEIKGSVCNIYY